MQNQEDNSKNAKKTASAKPKQKSFIFLKILMAILLGVAIFAGYKVFIIEKGYHEAKVSYDSVAEQYTGEDRTVQLPVKEEPEIVKEEEPTNELANTIQFKNVDFENLREEVNKDIIAWIRCPFEGSPIDYPVVQGRDNDHYLHYNVNGSYSSSGTIFLECQNQPNFSDRNNVMHGHHMMSGAMFASLEKWQNKEWYYEHPYMTLNTYYSGDYVAEVFAAFNTDDGSEVYRFIFNGDTDFLNWVDWVAAQSKIKTDVQYDANTSFITLSTCAYDGGPERRSVLVLALQPIA